MSRFETTFRNAVANAERDVMIEQIRSNPQMSLAELGKLATGELGSLLKGITIGEVLGQGAPAARASARGRSAAAAPAKARKGGRQAAPAAKEAAPSAAKRGGAAARPAVDTRTPAGREAYDQAMLNALKAAGGPQAAPQLSAVVGGTPLQVRTSLARLIERGLVTWTGQARGTRYTAV
ncbi:MAG TPA: hypothetical protein VIK91_03185 [Nannocystis sp.]